LVSDLESIQSNLSGNTRELTSLERRFYSVPGDVFTASQSTPASSSPKEKKESTKLSADWKDWWPDDGLKEWLDESGDPIAGLVPSSVWPLRIRGQKIGTCANLVDLAIDSGKADPSE